MLTHCRLEDVSHGAGVAEVGARRQVGEETTGLILDAGDKDVVGVLAHPHQDA